MQKQRRKNRLTKVNNDLVQIESSVVCTCKCALIGDMTATDWDSWVGTRYRI